MDNPLRLVAIVVAALLVASITAPANAAGRLAISVKGGKAGSAVAAPGAVSTSRREVRSVRHRAGAPARSARITAAPAARTIVTRHARGQARRSARHASSVLDRVNQLRRTGTRCGGTWYRPVRRLSYHRGLAYAARLYAVRMAIFRFFGHVDRVTGHGPGDRVSAAGYDWSVVGENVAAGYRTARAVVRAWRRSPSHCRNMMDPRWKHIGIGWHYAGRSSRWGHYWGQLFARPC